jgi:lysophospholipase L1-like esterase
LLLKTRRNKLNKKILYGIIGFAATGIAIALILRFRKKGETSNTPDEKKEIPKRILIVGDSQSAIQTADGKKITFTYPNILREKLADKGVTIDVLALGGKTTDWMKKNLPSKLKNNKYDRVIIYGGGNDASNASIPMSKITGNIQEMVDMSIDNGAEVYVNLGYLVQGDFGNHNIMPLTKYLKKKEDWIPYVEKRKELQRVLPKTIKNAKFILPYDLQSKTKDGIHPTASGHKIVADVIYDSIVNG